MLYNLIRVILFTLTLCSAGVASYLSGFHVSALNFTDLFLPRHLTGWPTVCVTINDTMICCDTEIRRFLRLPGRYVGLFQVELSLYAAPKPLDFQTTVTVAPTEVTTVLYHIAEATDFPINPNHLVHIESPPYGAIVQSQQLNIQLATDSDAYEKYRFSIVGLTDSILASTLQSLQSMHTVIEPGSWFYSITPMSGLVTPDTQTSGSVAVHSTETVYGYPAQSYMEFVLPDDKIQKLRYYRNHSGVVGNDRDIQGNQLRAIPSTSARSTTMVCIWSGDQIDGLRRIWLQQTQFMNSSKFSFTWFLSFDLYDVQYAQSEYEKGTSAHTLYANLQRLNSTQGNIYVHDSASLEVSMQDLQQIPDDGRPPAAELWHGNATFLYLYAHESLHFANYSIDHITPPWCKQFYINMRTSIKNSGCNVIIYGNERYFSSNVIITDTAHVLGIPSIAELSNHFVDPYTIPSVLISPSMYALHHQSVQSILREHNKGDTSSSSADRRSTAGPARAVVVPPGVDAALFCPEAARASERGLCKHPSCMSADVASQPCFRVGYLARLSLEKSPGLFLQAAYEILQLYPFARFTVVGDGPLRAPLEDLAARLRISWAVHFAGWVSSDQLPHLLAGFDAVINTSLWPETFCISNIEVMSMEVPLVTFAVGGIGEYVQDPLAGANVSGSLLDYSVSGNAVVVNRATPAAIAGAVHHLILHPALRSSIGRAGRETVVTHFTVQRQIALYEQLYSDIVR